MKTKQKPTGPRPEAQFKIMSGALKAFTRKDAEGKERRYLSCTASSSIKDLHEDEFTPSCVEAMAGTAAKKNMTIFLNHSYKVPEDVFGSTTMSKSLVRLGEDGLPYTDMDLEIVLNETNPRAVQTYDAIEQEGVKLGVSIGALIKAWHPRDPNDTWGWDGMVIEEVDLLEASIVGIPANPRSWVQNAVKSLKEAVKAAPEEDEDEGPDTQKLLDMIGSTESVKDAEETIDPAPITDDENSGDPESAAEGETSVMEKAAAKCPECGEAGCKNPAHKSAEPTSDPQPTSDGAASADATEVPETTESAPTDGAVVLSSTPVQDAFDLLIKGYQTKLAEQREQLTTVTTERDEALEALKTAMAIIDKIASLPLGRKTSFREATTTFKDRYGGVYGDDFLKFLERTDES